MTDTAARSDRRAAAQNVYVGVGSNIRPQFGLRAGVGAMQEAFGQLCVSSVYRSPALGFQGDDFLNVVVAFRSESPVDAVEAELDAIERSGPFGAPAGRFAPRALDCDLLLYGQRVDARRRLPRDDVLRYAFVLAPLAEIAPQLRHPLDGRRFESHWQQRRRGAELRRICSFDALELPADAASAVDGENLSGNVGGVPGEV